MPAKTTTQKFIQQAHATHGDKYDYSLTLYTGRNYKVSIVCRTHGPFLQSPQNHLNGANCPVCGQLARTKSIIASTGVSLDQFIVRSNEKHNNKYDYSNIKTFITVNNKVNIICPIHGQFKQMAYSHLAGSKCPKCKGNIIRQSKSSTTEIFIKMAATIHNNKYNYENVNYTNNSTHISIVCPKHGIFQQRPADHLRGSGCSHCYNFTSGPETAWLNFMGVPNDDQSRQLILYLNNKRFMFDGFCKETNTVYEFWGDFWHGNLNRYKPTDINVICNKTFGELYEKTQQKRQLILNAGYNLAEIWESDWNKIKQQ
jgi:hypothetical protein